MNNNIENELEDEINVINDNSINDELNQDIGIQKEVFIIRNANINNDKRNSDRNDEFLAEDTNESSEREHVLTDKADSILPKLDEDNEGLRRSTRKAL